MKFSALKIKLLLFLPSLFILGFLIIAPQLVKPANAVLCGLTFSPTAAANSTLAVTVSGPVGDTFSVGIVDRATLALIGTKVSGTMPTSGPLSLSIGTPAAGNYKVVVNDDSANPQPNLCVVPGGGSDNLTVNASTGTTTAECAPGTTKTDAEAVDAVNKCRISRNEYDDKASAFNIIAGFGDGLYLHMTGKSLLFPDTNGVTAGMGALAMSSKMVAAVYAHPPVSGMDYMAGEFRKFNPVAPAYAADGIGFNALQPVQQIWESFRNISYAGFVIVFIVIGFMIMFRAHISPQAVATVQDSLPRIVIALFLVTFSYAIAGFMIDLMFLLLNIIINTLPGAGDKTYVFHKSVFGVIWNSWKDIFGTVKGALEDIITGTMDLGFLDKIVGFFGGWIGALVVGIALLFVMFKVFVTLLTSYAYIVILTITAPFFFLMQALPGNNSGQAWFKQMAANISVFPVIAIMFIFAGILGGIPALGGTPGAGAIDAGKVGQFPLFAGDIDTAAIGQLIAIGILLMTPSAAELVKNALNAKGPNAGAGIGASLAGGTAVVGAAGRAGWQRAYDKGPLGARSRASEARRSEKAQEDAHAGIYSEKYSEVMNRKKEEP